jgi:hypothetical protein
MTSDEPRPDQGISETGEFGAVQRGGQAIP